MKRYIYKVIIFFIILLFIAGKGIFGLINESSRTTEMSGKGCIILCYHRILPVNKMTSYWYRLVKRYTNDNELRLYSITGLDFEKQIKYLKENNIKILTLEDLEYHIYNKIDLPDKSVIITFDDVDESVYKNAYPILKKYHIPFSLFVITGHVGNKTFKGLKLSSWHEIKEMYDSGLVSLGLHTHNFHYLDKKNNPPFMNPNNSSKFNKDTLLAIKTMEKNMGIRVRYFSYPYGFGIPETDSGLLGSGMKLIFTLRPGVTTKEDKPFFIKRILLNDANWRDIQNWIENK